jgi:hypothetical protein
VPPTSWMLEVSNTLALLFGLETGGKGGKTNFSY